MLVLLCLWLRPSQQSQLKASGHHPEALLFSASIIENSPKTRNKLALPGEEGSLEPLRAYLITLFIN
jgi:hypothetical protein